VEKDLQSIVAETLNIDRSIVDENLARDTRHEWDSFVHLVLISEIEKRLGISFTVDEVTFIQDYKQLKELVAVKIKESGVKSQEPGELQF
jgi:acyl carrier protein